MTEDEKIRRILGDEDYCKYKCRCARRKAERYLLIGDGKPVPFDAFFIKIFKIIKKLFWLLPFMQFVKFKHFFIHFPLRRIAKDQKDTKT
jgi:hypothetical protein